MAFGANFYQRDACYASALCPCLSVSVCLSVTSRSSINRDERISLLFGMKASFDQSYTVIYINSVIYKNKGTSR